MSVVVNLPSKSIELPSDRLAEFIRQARYDLDTLIDSADWDEPIWTSRDGTFFIKGQNRITHKFFFYTLETSISSSQEVVGDPLERPFVDFAKSYVRYQHAASPVVFGTTTMRLVALRHIEAGFRALSLPPAIENLNVAVLNKAVQIAGERSPMRQYQIAAVIQRIHRFCMEQKFLYAPFQWKHGVKFPGNDTVALGDEAKRRREKKLPSPEAFLALAHVFRNAETFSDKLFSSVCAICISIPIRAHEVLQLRADCEVYGSTTGDDGESIETYGIRVWPGKGNPPQVKWVPTQMVTVVKEGVARLRDMCAPAREVAAWYEAHPDEVWLPQEHRGLGANGWIDIQMVDSIVGSTPLDDIGVWLRLRKITRRNREVSIAALSAFFIPMLPRDFPFFNSQKDQRYSDTLILLLFGQNRQNRRTHPCMIEQATINAFERWLSGHDNGVMPSVFQRWGFYEADGADIKITTHAFRHWLNTVAQFKGMSDLDIAKWSGRNIAQNTAYNHVTDEEIISQIRQAVDEGSVIGPMFEPSLVQGVNTPIDRREFINAQIGAALVTDYGLCVHDYSLLPCQSHGDCLGCTENVFMKGDSKHIAKVEGRLALAEKQLLEATEAHGEGYYGADRWVQSHTASVSRMRKMLSIHADATIPDGTIVNLPGGTTDSEVAMAVRDRASQDSDAVEEADADTDDELGDIVSSMWGDHR